MDTTIGVNQTFLRMQSPSGIGPHNLYFTRFVSPPLYQASIPANTAWKYSIATRESTTSANFPVGSALPLRITLYVWRPSTSTKVGTILEGNSTTTVTEPAGATIRASNVTFSGSGVSNMQNGDVLICEIWFQITQTSPASGYNCDLYYDGATVTTTDVTVTNHASYIETPDTLQLTQPTNPTRFYFRDIVNSTPGLPTSEQSTLTADFTVENTNRTMNTSITTGIAQQIQNNLTPRTTSLQNHYFTRFVSPPIYQTTVAANTWTYNFATRTTTTSANFPVSGTNQPVYVNCYVWRPSNSTKVGTILDGDTSSTAVEGAASVATSQVVTFTGVQVTGVQNGDVIILEIWFRITQAGTTGYLDDFIYDGKIVTTTTGVTVTDPATFLETPETLVLTPPPNPTRLYFHNALSSLANLPTTEQGNLNVTTAPQGYAGDQSINRTMDTTIGTSEIQMSNPSIATTTGNNYYYTRFVSPPLVGTTFDPNDWKYSIACRQSNVSANFPVNGTGAASGGLVRMAIYLWRPSTQTKIGSIADIASTTVVTEGAANEKRAYNVTANHAGGSFVDGDVIIAEVWFQVFQASATSYTQEFFYDGTNVTETNTTVTSHASFIETPQTLTFSAPPTGPIAMTITAVKDLVNKFITKVIGTLFNVQDTTPVAGATNVAITVTPQVTFTDPPTPGTITNANCKLFVDATSVEVPSTLSFIESNIIDINPNADLSNSVVYRISISTGVTRAADGVPLPSTFISTFTTEAVAVPQPFTVISTSPTNTAADVPLNVSPQIQLSHPYLPTSVNSTNVKLLNHTTLAAIPYNPDTTVPGIITLDPVSDLALNTIYRIELPAGGLIRQSDLQGIDAYTSTFTTIVSVPPPPFTVVSITPTSGATNQSQTVVPLITFSHDYFGSSRTSTNVQLLDHASGNPVSPLPILGTTANNTLTITPAAPLALNTTYRIFLPAGGIKRFMDNVGLTSDFTSTFTTTATAPTLVDNWGTTWLLPTATGGRVYHAPLTTGSNRTLASGTRDGTDDMIARGDSSWTVNVAAGTVTTTGPAPRLYFYPASGSLKWENCEITGYYRYQTFTGTASEQGFQGFELGNRGQHEDGGTNARTYYTRNPVNGSMQRLKEEQHSNVLNTVTIGGAGTFPYPANTWIGVKFILRNKTNGGVHMESWRDTTDGSGGGNWIKSWEFDDNPTGSWGGWPPYVSTLALCRCASFFFRTDNMTNFACKKISAHQVDPMP